MSDLPKIFVYRPTKDSRDCAGVAYSEDGEILCFHVSSNYGFFRDDMGFNGDVRMAASKYPRYREKYPAGFELVEVIGMEAMDELIDSGAVKGLARKGAPECGKK